MPKNGEMLPKDEQVEAARRDFNARLREETVLIVYVRPWANGRNQPGDVTRLYPEEAERLTKSRIVLPITDEEADAIKEGLTDVQAFMEIANAGPRPILPEGDDPVPWNLAPPMAARASDAATEGRLVKQREARRKLDWQDRLGLIPGYEAIGGVRAIDSASGTINEDERTVGRARPIDHLMGERGQEAGASDPAVILSERSGVNVGGAGNLRGDERSALAEDAGEAGERDTGTENADPLAAAREAAKRARDRAKATNQDRKEQEKAEKSGGDGDTSGV